MYICPLGRVSCFIGNPEDLPVEGDGTEVESGDCGGVDIDRVPEITNSRTEHPSEIAAFYHQLKHSLYLHSITHHQKLEFSKSLKGLCDILALINSFSENGRHLNI